MTGTTTNTYEDSLTNILKYSGLPTSQQLMIKMVVDAYPTNTSINDMEILNTFQKLSAQVVDPYYNNLIQTETDDLTRYIAQKTASTNQAIARASASAASSARSAGVSYEAQRKMNDIEAGQRIEGAQSSLEASGLSRSGQSLKLLGTYALPGEAKMEGQIPMYNRTIAENSKAAYNAAVSSASSSAGLAASGYQLGLAQDIENAKANYAKSVKSIQETQQSTKGTLLQNLISQQDALGDYSRLFL
jgi:hypothetical protein